MRIPEGLRAQQVAEKEPGWQDFLRKWGIWDQQKNDEDLYIRYLKFKDKTFPTAPREQWPVLKQESIHPGWAS